MNRRSRATRLAALALGVAACTTARAERLPAETVAAHLPELAASGTTRDDLLLRLGPPSAEFEGGRIFTWRLAEREEHWIPARPEPSADFGGSGAWSRARYSLVVVFDARGVAERSSLIAVR